MFRLAGEPRFVELQEKTVQRARILAHFLEARDFRLISDGTDNHQVLVDLTGRGLNGTAAEAALKSAGIVLNDLIHNSW